MGSEATAPGLKPEVDAPKRFSSERCIITLCLGKAWMLGQVHVNMRSKNKPKTRSHWKNANNYTACPQVKVP